VDQRSPVKSKGPNTKSQSKKGKAQGKGLVWKRPRVKNKVPIKEFRPKS